MPFVNSTEGCKKHWFARLLWHKMTVPLNAKGNTQEKWRKNFVGYVVNAAIWWIPVQVRISLFYWILIFEMKKMHVSCGNGQYGIKLCRVGWSTQNSIILGLRLGFSVLVTTCINMCVIYFLYYPKLYFVWIVPTWYFLK